VRRPVSFLERCQNAERGGNENRDAQESNARSKRQLPGGLRSAAASGDEIITTRADRRALARSAAYGALAHLSFSVDWAARPSTPEDNAGQERAGSENSNRAANFGRRGRRFSNHAKLTDCDCMKAVFVEKPGGVENLRYAEVPEPSPGPGQALVKIAVSGVNFIDIYYRTGLYKADPPILLGMEAAGVVEAVGPDVTEVRPGDRVAYAMARGSHAEYAAVPAWQLVPLPDSIDFKAAAAVMLQGMTAHYLTHSTFPLKQGDTCLVHAAAGGVGLLLVQIAKKRGATVIGTVGSEAKAELARKAGADHVILYTQQDFQPEARRLTGGRGVDVVYDSVGASTFMKSLDSLRPRGMMVSFGNASGPVPEFAPLLLNQKGSLFLTRPSLAHYAATREELMWRAGDLFHWIQEGSLEIRIEKIYRLADAAQAQLDLAARKTAGKLLLEP